MDLDFEKLSKFKPFIALPCFGGKMEVETVQGLLGFQALCYATGIKNEFFFLSNQALVSRARNHCVAEFISDPSFTHLFFIDADMGFEGADILKLMSRDKDIVSAPCPKKSFPITYATSFLVRSMRETGQPTGVVRDGELIGAQHVGAAFLCIKRTVIEKMINFYPELKCEKFFDELCKKNDPRMDEVGKHVYSLFDTLQINGEYFGEDNTFCYRWVEEMGGEIWLDSTVNVTHVGRYVYEGDLSLLKGI